MKLINCFQRERKVGGWEGVGNFTYISKGQGLESKLRELQALNFKTAFQHHGLAMCNRHSKRGFGSSVQGKTLKREKQ